MHSPGLGSDSPGCAAQLPLRQKRRGESIGQRYRRVVGQEVPIVVIAPLGDEPVQRQELNA